MKHFSTILDVLFLSVSDLFILSTQGRFFRLCVMKLFHSTLTLLPVQLANFFFQFFFSRDFTREKTRNAWKVCLPLCRSFDVVGSRYFFEEGSRRLQWNLTLVVENAYETVLTDKNDRFCGCFYENFTPKILIFSGILNS